MSLAVARKTDGPAEPPESVYDELARILIEEVEREQLEAEAAG